MTRFHFVRPDLWRLFWSIVGIATASCLLLGTILAVEFAIQAHGKSSPPNYLGLWFFCVFLYSWWLLLSIWQITVPVVLVLGGLLASLRRTRET
ncbi:conserved hypothetical protein [Segniliparus rotundus DSM 44985]|uniref:Uncharacterized protein n=1 Tax=Segniliparus rotundus (strain ATCC BAA-972 / CDC 1076 / CIP 108378 / DSM 44985 / JCM 13578) TaxID=640132 RepID=D6ZEM5_SEGRD|nr:hypothetical protein [Segniliparus rotundus]ADG97399.1 conserved hypothetical protein [Segniliparus rotundus DSM 44985]